MEREIACHKLDERIVSMKRYLYRVFCHVKIALSQRHHRNTNSYNLACITTMNDSRDEWLELLIQNQDNHSALYHYI
jgi:hypothetical protein